MTGISSMPWQESRVLFPTKEFKGLRVLDVASGLSDVVANLLERGANAYGVDPVYRNLFGLKAVSEEYLEHKLVALIQGNNQVTHEIKKIPVGNWSSHRALFIQKRRNR